MEEENLKQVFVGKKYNKFEKKVFSIPAFLFGGIYFAYRKMLIHSLLVIIIVGLIDTIAMKLQNLGLTIITVLCIHIAIALFFPLWYRTFYNKKVKNIIDKNSTKTEQEGINICQKQGGTSILLLIIFIIINSIFTSYFYKIDIGRYCTY